MGFFLNGTQLSHEKDLIYVTTFDFHMLACKITPLISKLTD